MFGISPSHFLIIQPRWFSYLPTKIIQSSPLILYHGYPKICLYLSILEFRQLLSFFYFFFIVCSCTFLDHCFPRYHTSFVIGLALFLIFFDPYWYQRKITTMHSFLSTTGCKLSFFFFVFLVSYLEEAVLFFSCSDILFIHFTL